MDLYYESLDLVVQLQYNMAYKRTRSRGQFSVGQSRTGKSFTYAGRRVLIRDGNFELNWSGGQVIQEILDSVEFAFQALSVSALEYMQNTVPVDTGDLRESCYAEIDVTSGNIRLVIGAGMPYAIYVELGTFRNAAQPYIRPTFDYIVSIIPEILNNEIARRARSGIT